MTHIDYTKTTKTERTTSDWLRVGSEIAKVANTWANRDDLVVFVGEGATEGEAPALFKPEIAEIEIDVEKAFGFGVTPKHIEDFTSIQCRYEFPRATGAVLHEAFHARFSRWSMPKAFEELKSDEYEALMLLEEGRIEALGLKLDANYKLFLRASAFELALGDLSEDALNHLNVANSTKLMGLLNARVVAGIFDADEVASITDAIKTIVDEKSFNRLVEIMAEFQSITSVYDITAGYPLAIEWAEIVRNLKKERGEQEGEGQGSGSGKGVSIKDVMEAIKELGEDIEVRDVSARADQERQEQWNKEVEESYQQAKEQEKNREIAEQVFDEKQEGAKTTSKGNGTGKTSSRLVETRPPAGVEYSAAITVARLLEKAKYRDRDITTVTSQVPQGKLRTNAVIQNEALKAKGMLPTANTWKHKTRKQTDEPKLTVGVMVDISGSMSDAMQPMATTAWVMSEAVRRIQGKTAMVYFGESVFPVLKPGQHLSEVNVYSAKDGTEKFDTAFRALDGAMNLLNGNGVRLLVVVSDGVFTHQETKLAREWVQKCQQAGVGVLWLTFNKPSYSEAENICKGTHAVVLSGTLNPAEAAVEIGRASASALEITNRVA